MPDYLRDLDRPVQIESTPASVLFALSESDVTGDPIRLTGLGPGGFRALRPDEVRSLYQAVGL